MTWLSKLTFAQKIILSASIPLTSLLLYLLLRRDDDEEENERVVLAQHISVEVAVPQECVGAVIGAQGSQIKEIQEKTKTRVKFYDDRGASAGKDRMLTIRGKPDGVQQAELMIRHIIADQPPIVTETILVPQTALGCIIGKNGETIRTLCRQSKAKISIERSDAAAGVKTEAEVYLKGSPAAVETAKILLEEKVNEEREYLKRKGKFCDERTAANKNNSASTKPVCNSLKPASGPVADGRLLSQIAPVKDLLEVSEEFIPVYVSAVEHPMHFWVQMINSQSLQLEELINQLTVLYGNTESAETLKSDIKAGDMVAAPFEGDTRWYRAKVLDVIDNNQVDLYYVDYGDGGIVSIDIVKPLRAEHLALPYQAMECCLSGIKSATGDEWSEEAMVVFEKLTHVAKWVTLMCQTVGVVDMKDGSFRPCVRLIDTNCVLDVDIAKALVERGLAVELNSEYAEPASHS